MKVFIYLFRVLSTGVEIQAQNGVKGVTSADTDVQRAVQMSSIIEKLIEQIVKHEEEVRKQQAQVQQDNQDRQASFSNQGSLEILQGFRKIFFSTVGARIQNRFDFGWSNVLSLGPDLSETKLFKMVASLDHFVISYIVSRFHVL